MVWRGRPKLKDEKIGSSLKKQWKMVQLPDYQKFSATPEDLEAIIAADREKEAKELAAAMSEQPKQEEEQQQQLAGM